MALLWSLGPVAFFLLALGLYAQPAQGWLSGSFAPWLQTALGSYLPNWLIELTFWLTGAFVGIAVMVISYATTRLFAGVFFSLIAERVLEEDGRLPRRSKREQLWLLLRMFLVSANKALFFFAIGVSVFLLSLIPGLGFLGVMGFLFVLSFDVMDYAHEAYGSSLSERFAFFFRHRAEAFGVAAGFALILWIPVVNVLLFPCAVAGAAELVGRLRNGSG